MGPPSTLSELEVEGSLTGDWASEEGEVVSKANHSACKALNILDPRVNCVLTVLTGTKLFILRRILDIALRESACER